MHLNTGEDINKIAFCRCHDMLSRHALTACALVARRVGIQFSVIDRLWYVLWTKINGRRKWKKSVANLALTRGFVASEDAGLRGSTARYDDQVLPGKNAKANDAYEILLPSLCAAGGHAIDPCRD